MLQFTDRHQQWLDSDLIPRLLEMSEFRIFLCNLVHYSKSRLHTNFEVRRRQRRREMIKNVFKMESGQSTLRNIFSQKIFIESCVAFKITYSHENLCKNIHRVALESELKILPKNL